MPNARIILDLTDQSNHDRRKGERDEADVDALVLHQMGFDRGNSPLRYLNTIAHFIILRDGQIAQLHRPIDYLHASSALNARSVSVEFAGNMPSERARYFRPEEFGRHRVTIQQVSAGRFLCKHLKETLGISYVFAHRQGTNGHTNCCGPDVWFNVGQYMVAKGELSDGGQGFTMGDGLPIPHSWRSHNYMVFTLEEAGRLPRSAGVFLLEGTEEALAANRIAQAHSGLMTRRAGARGGTDPRSQSVMRFLGNSGYRS